MERVENGLSNKKMNYQLGFTLIEVLISILLLSIILTSFFAFFTQASLFTQNNGNKLSDMEIAQLIIKTIDEKVTTDQLKQNTKNSTGQVESPIIDANEIVQSNSSDGFYHIYGIPDIKSKLNITLNIPNESSYYGEVVMSNKISTVNISTDSGVTSNTINLILVKVIVNQGSTANTGNQSKTFTYIRR